MFPYLYELKITERFIEFNYFYPDFFTAQNSSSGMLPLECQYLNKSSLNAIAGHIPESTKHFTVKRKPKSAALRADIIHKCKELATLFAVVNISYFYLVWPKS